MRKVISIIVLGLVFIVLNAGSSYAQWWRFGKTEAIPEISDFFVAGIAVTSILNGELFVDESNLEGGNVVMKGFTQTGKAPLAIAKISLDNGAVWIDVNIDANSFIYQFKPEADKEYKIICKVIDTAGNESDPRDVAPLILVYRAVDLNQIAGETLRAMIKNYVSKNLGGFSRYISDYFVGDFSALEEAVQSDFRKYDNINMDITIQQVSRSGNQAIVDFEFDWSGIKKSDGSIIHPARGKTTYIFVQEGNAYKLSSMAVPIIFGISEASEIAATSTGSVVDATSSTFRSEDTFAPVTLTVHTATINTGTYITFSTGNTCAAGGDVGYYQGQPSPISCNAAYIYTDWGIGTLEDHTSVSSYPGANWNTSWSDSGVGKVYGVYTGNGKYAIFQITGGGTMTDNYLTIRYKYQSDGTTSLP